MDLQTSFGKYVTQENLFNKGNRLLLAVSGGLDSVVLCDLCITAGYDIVLAHCNFQLRGPESERDEEFVRALAAEYNKPVLVKRFDTATYAAEHKLSIQVAARELRYNWFYSLLGTAGDKDHPGAQYILTAHHRDDNIETLLMNFFKGTGIAGLRGILPKQCKLIRPLLFAGREELLQYAQANQLQWVEDSSNASDKYTRNAIRHKLIPMVQELFPQALDNLGDSLQRFRDIEMLYQQSINMHTKKLIEIKGNEVHIPVLKLAKAEPLNSIVFEIIREYGFSSAQTPEVIELLNSETGKYVQSASHRVIRNRNWLIIAPVAAEEAQHILIEAGTDSVQFAGGTLSLKRMPAADHTIPNDARVASLDAKHVQFPLILRPWKKGDYFYPLGMTKKKKVARFLIDQKLSATDKEKIWVIEMDKKIIWIAGHRIDDRYKISNSTAEILRLQLH